MNYRNRDSTYVFTVTKNDTAEKFFKELRSHKPPGTQLFRMGRQRNRKSISLTRVRKQGRVPIQYSDRWDVYIRVPYTGNFQTYAANQTAKAQEFIRNSAAIIKFYQSLVEYSNEAHKPLFETIFNSQTVNVQTKMVKQGMEWSTKHNKWEPVYTKVPVLTAAGVSPKCSPSNDDWKNEMTEAINKNYDTMRTSTVEQPKKVLDENMNQTSKWNFTARVEGMNIGGKTQTDLETVVKRMFIGTKTCVVLNCEKVDEHQDLPLVQFTYPQHGNPNADLRIRIVRVTKMDDNQKVLEGFEDGVFKTFLYGKIVGSVKLMGFAPEKKG